jgi:uncharacterized protein YqjF (DUF2071 family)
MSGASSDKIDRLFIRTRPQGSPIMYQSWGKLLFMHWPVPVETLRPLLPPRLTLDTFAGTAWIAVTPFNVWNARPVFLPPVPWVSNFHEINVRTYVHLNGVPGVWFFSLDANSVVAVWGARTFFHLPYHTAHITLRQEGEAISYHARRKDRSVAAEFEATWTIGGMLGQAEFGTREFFLVERYCLYTAANGKLYRGRIFHPPWMLQEAEHSSYAATMLEVQGIPTPVVAPLLHYAEAVHVAIWPLEQV